MERITILSLQWKGFAENDIVSIFILVIISPI